MCIFGCMCMCIFCMHGYECILFVYLSIYFCLVFIYLVHILYVYMRIYMSVYTQTIVYVYVRRLFVTCFTFYIESTYGRSMVFHSRETTLPTNLAQDQWWFYGKVIGYISSLDCMDCSTLSPQSYFYSIFFPKL